MCYCVAQFHNMIKPLSSKSFDVKNKPYRSNTAPSVQLTKRWPRGAISCAIAPRGRRVSASGSVRDLAMQGVTGDLRPHNIGGMPRRPAARVRIRPAPPRTQDRAHENGRAALGHSQSRARQPSLSGSGTPAPVAPFAFSLGVTLHSPADAWSRPRQPQKDTPPLGEVARAARRKGADKKRPR